MLLNKCSSVKNSHDTVATATPNSGVGQDYRESCLGAQGIGAGKNFAMPAISLAGD
jgi:hypothetical protein